MGEMHDLLIVGFVLGSLLVAIVAFAVYGVRAGKIQRSRSATRREKNLRHLMTLPALLIAVGMIAFALHFGGRTSVALLCGGAFFILFVVPLRSIAIEFGLRRMPAKTPNIDS